MKLKTCLVIFMMIVIPVLILSTGKSTIEAQGTLTPPPSNYATLQTSEIRGIDPATIKAYQNGQGMGLALPAELNGYAGPRHVLELADQLLLTSTQREQIQMIFDAMKLEAVDLGSQILSQEASLERAFRERTIDETTLETQLTALGNLQAKLRFVHLQSHLATMKILTAQQLMQYNILRGYNSSEAPPHHEMSPSATPN